MSASPSTPAPAVPRPTWKDAVFNYGTLVGVVLLVLGSLFVQVTGLGAKFERLDERMNGLGKRMDRVEKVLEQVQATQVEHGLILREIVVELRQLRGEQKKP